MKVEARNILQQRADEDARARREALRQRREYRDREALHEALRHASKFSNRPFEILLKGK